MSGKEKGVDLASLSDEEIMNLDPSELPEDEEEQEVKEDSPTPDVDPAGDQSAAEDDEEDTPPEEPDGADSEEESLEEPPEGADETSDKVDEETGNEEDQPDDSEQDTEDDQASEDSAEKDGEVSDSTEEVDYQAELARVMAPFKAAKRQIKVDSVEDARRLMQMGVDYSRKMEAMKPYQKVLKTLERNNLLDMERVNFMIDLSNKNPEAIKKFLKDSKIDPMELDLENSTEYKPNDHGVSEKELVLDDVIDSIRGSESFDRTVDVITNQWDTASRQILLDTPSIIRTLNDHVEAGLFDQIADRLATEKILGKHMGLSDLEAYKAVGDAMHSEGAFKVPDQNTPPPSGKTTQDVQDPNAGSEVDTAAAKRKSRRKAASPTKGSAATRKKVPNFAGMTDEQIEQFDINSL